MVDRERLICPSASLVDGGAGVRFTIDRRRAAPEPAFAVRFEGVVRAFFNRCVHVPMELDWNAGNFFDASGTLLICSTHGAMYDPTTGGCAGGPCRGGRLEPVPVVERDGAVFLAPPDEHFRLASRDERHG